MSHNVVKLVPHELGCLKTNFDDVQHLFGQIPLHISSSGTIGIEGESHSRIIMFEGKALAAESVVLRRLFVLDGNISMDGVKSEPTHPSRALSAQFDDTGHVVSIEFGNIEPIGCGRQPKVDIVSSHGFHASFDAVSHKCDRVLMGPIKWNRGDPTVVGKDRDLRNLRIKGSERSDDLVIQRYFEFLPHIPIGRVVAIKNEHTTAEFNNANDGFMRIVYTSGYEPEELQRNARPPPSVAVDELRKQLRSGMMSLENMSEVCVWESWIEKNPLRCREREINERFARTALMWVDRVFAQFNTRTHAWVFGKCLDGTSAPSLGAAAFNRLTAASCVLDAMRPAQMALKKQNGCNCSPLSSKCRNPFCSVKPSRALLTSFPKSTTVEELDTMRREIADRLAQDKKRVEAQWAAMRAFERRLTAFMKKNPSMSRLDASEALRLQEAKAAAASAHDAPGGFAVTKSGPKTKTIQKKKGGSKTRKRKHRKLVR